jgi:ribonuclease Z
MPSHNLSKIEIEELTLTGFDIGKAPDQIISINNVLLTHGHMDHAAGLAYYLSHRNFEGQSPGRVLAPENLIPSIKKIIIAWGRLDGNQVPAELVGVKPGDEYQIKPNIFARVFPTNHCRGSVGYTIIEKRKKLKTEYTELTGGQIVELKRQGVEIDYTMEIPIVTYLGDTGYADYDELDYVKNSRILITECTFYVDEHTARAKAGRHLHLNEFTKLLEKLNNEYVIITHTTQRTPFMQAKRMLKAAVSDEIYEKVNFLMDRKNSAKKRQQSR